MIDLPAASTFTAIAADPRFLLAMGISVLSGAVRGFSGFGSALIYVPLMSALYGPKIGATAGGLCLAGGCILAGLMKSYLGLVLGYKALSLLAYAGCCWLIWASVEPARRQRALAVFAWSPLVIFEVLGKLHNDSLLALSILSMVWLLGRHHATRGWLASLAVDTWGVDFVLLDRRGELLGYPYHYRDSRHEPAMAAALRKAGRERIFAVTGVQFLPFNTLFQLYADARERYRIHVIRVECVRYQQDMTMFSCTAVQYQSPLSYTGKVYVAKVYPDGRFRYRPYSIPIWLGI